MRCRAVAHLRAVGCRSLAVVAALFTVMAVMFAPQAMAADGSADYDTWADVAAAMVLLIIFFVIRFTSVKIPIGPFFLVTSILMSVLVVVFAGGGVHSLIEGDALPATYLQGVPTNDWLGFYPYVECIIAQVIAAIAVIALFVVGFIKQRKAKAKAAVTAGAPNNQPNNL